MDLYVRYLKDYYNKNVITFSDVALLVTVDVSPTEVYWEDIYVTPEARESKVALRLCNKALKIAQDQGKTTIIGSADPKSKMFKRSMKLMELYGFEITGTANGLIILKKGI